ncbi:MAG: ABC transporter ATP-binding protein [Armatimonadota bacterium]
MEDKYKPKNKRAAFGRLLGYIKPYKQSFTIGVISNIGIGLIGLVPAQVYGKLITDRVIMTTSKPVSGRVRLLVLSVLALSIIYIASAILSFVRGYVMHVLGERIIRDLRKQIFARLQILSVSYFDSRQTGEIMSRVTSDTQVVEEFVNHAADTLISDVVRLLAMCAVMFCESSKLAFVALIPVPIMFFLAFRFARRIRTIYRAVRERLAEISANAQERIGGIRVVKAFAREDYEYQCFESDVESYYDQRVKAVKMWTSFFPSVDLLIQTGTLAVWIVGATMVMKGELTLGAMVVFTFYLGMLYQPVGNLARINDTIQRSLAAAERIFEVVDEEPLIADAYDAIDMPRIEGRVEFDHVDFKYEDGEYVLKDICVKAEPGQIVALVGRSGAGKTSIVNLIPRFYDPSAGRVLIDGFDVKSVRQTSIRRQVAMVLQDTFLFNGTVRENIRYGKLDATDGEIIDAAKAANAHEFIEVMPKGYDTEIGERGIKLSGGQKQRLAIARAVLADPRILILDEATSSVDSESEYLIHRAMDRLMEGRTTFVIAHRLSTVKHADQIITLEHGRVTEIGDHKSLLDQDGVYSQMYSMQFRLNEDLS